MWTYTDFYVVTLAALQPPVWRPGRTSTNITPVPGVYYLHALIRKKNIYYMKAEGLMQ